MIYNINPLIKLIRKADLSSPSCARLSAIGGLVNELESFYDDIQDLKDGICRLAFQQFMAATTFEEQSDWLMTLKHIYGNGAFVVYGAYSDDDFDRFDALQESIELRQLASLTELTNGKELHPWSDLSLKERLHRLCLFYQEDINQFTNGDDQKARVILLAADNCFEQCRNEMFEGKAYDIDTFSLYYQVLCLCRPNYRHTAHVPYYKQYFRIFDCLGEGLPDDSTEQWQYREVMWHHRLQSERHYDLSLLPRLSLGDTTNMQSFRQQCYLWLLDLDPDDDFYFQTYADHQRFVRKGRDAMLSWYQAKTENNISIPVEQEANVLLTLLCTESLLGNGMEGSYMTEDRAYTLLPDLPGNKLRIHLMGHLAMVTQDDELQNEVNAAISEWSDDEYTLEDRNLIAFLEPVHELV